MTRLRSQRAHSSRNPFARRLRLEFLEDRRLLAFGELLQTLVDPGAAAPASSRFGHSVAIDGPYTVVGTPCADLSSVDKAGVVYVFDSSTGALVATLNNPAPAYGDAFGWSVAISGSTVVVGTPYDDIFAGSAYVFDAASGNLLRTLNNPDPGAGDYFGRSVAISGSTIVVGTPYDYKVGSAYVFDGSSGNLLRTLNNPTPAAGDAFGCSVAVSGSTIVVGAYHDNASGTNAGSAYVFDAATGNLLRTLAAPGLGYDFGRSVAVSDSTIVVGVPYGSMGARDAGSACVYDAASGNLLRTLNNPNPAVSDKFGSSVAVSGSTIVVGTPGNDTGATGAGSAYVFDAASGSLLRTLHNPTPAVSDDFGASAAVSGDTIVVGTLWEPTGAFNDSSVYIFGATSGNLLQTLNNPTPAAYDEFGCSVAVSDSTIVVGAFGDAADGYHFGSAYVYDAAGGSLLWTLNNPTPAAGDKFGYSVALSGSTIVVGSPYGSKDVLYAGSVCVFDAASGSLLRTLNSPTPTMGDNFGSSVAISGNMIVVGAPYDDTGATNAGSAYVFDAASGNLLQTLNNPTPAADDRFGCTVAVSGSAIVVGAPYDDTGATDAGSAYVFDATSGNLLRTLNNLIPAAYDDFGYSVAVSGSTVVVGTPYDDTGAIYAGAAYVFDAASGNLLRTLNNPALAAYDSFGCAVAISGSTIVVGANHVGADASWVGSAYVFDAASGNLLRTLNNPTPATSDCFGYSVAVSGANALIGACGVDGRNTNTGEAYLFDVTPNQPPVAMADAYTLDEDAILEQSAPGVLTNDSDPEGDSLSVSLITGAAHGSLTLNSDGSFRYQPDNDYGGQDSFIYQASDGSLTSSPATVTITVTPLNDSPVLSNIEAALLGYLPKQPATPITATLTANDIDSPMLAGATVQITAGFQGNQDLLLFANTGTISGTWDKATGTLSLTGSDTVANYEAALRAIKYRDTSAKPNLATRTIRFKVNDGQADSDFVTRNVAFYPPVLSGIEPKAATYTEKKPAVVVSAKITLKDGNSPKMVGATVRISAGYQADQDVLSLVDTKKIKAAWDPTAGTLTLSGSDTVANYQKALRAVKYLNTSANPSVVTRTVSFQVSDGLLVSNVVTRDLNVKAVNDVPLLSGMESSSLAYLVGSGATQITSSILVADADSRLTEATVAIAGGYKTGQDVLVFANTATIAGTWDAARGILTLTGSDTPAAYQAALRTIRFQNTAASPTMDWRKINFTVTDGMTASKSLTRSIMMVKNTAPSAGPTPGLLEALASLRPAQSAQTARQTLFAGVQNWAVDPSS